MKKAAVRGIAVALPSDVAAAPPRPCLADTDVEGGEATGGEPCIPIGLQSRERGWVGF